jgi:transcriptional regulator with XRE-family HTH domain
MSIDNAKMKKTRIDDIDRYVSSRLRARRMMLGLSQQALGNEVCVSVQQIQKYEKANNRISSGKLYHFANFLNVPVSYFFEEIGVKSAPHGFAESQEQCGIDSIAHEREVLVLVRAYNAINDANLRRKVVDLVRSMSIN